MTATGDWVFGIDGGGTSSRIRAESLSGSLLYQGSGGSTNLNASDARSVSAELGRLVSGALASGLDPAECRSGFIGSAGVDLEQDRETMATALSEAFHGAARRARPDTVRRLYGPAFAAGNDAEPALVGALDDLEGFLLIAGTGSIAFGRTRAGERARAGGWGHFLGDEGSAFWIAFEAVKRGIRAGESRDVQTTLLESALLHFRLQDAQSLIPFTYGNFNKATIASFAPLVAGAAAAGDALARDIMEHAAKELATLAISVFDALASRMVHPRLALYGGLLDKNEWLNAQVSARISAARPALAVVKPIGDAQTGACRLARALPAQEPVGLMNAKDVF
jgi:N-acetylglucosamine kinase-like BadF-type ATPase